MIPFLDWAIGSDENNPREIVPQLEEDRYYRILTYITVPMHFIVLIAIAWFVGTTELSAWAVLALAITAGSYSGLGINGPRNTKKTKLERWLAKIVLAVPAYGHFCIEHNRGHHTEVATPEDPASSRMGESIYKFMLGKSPARLPRLEPGEGAAGAPGQISLALENDILQSFAISAVLQIG